jgi:hypothetical protein
MDEFDKANKIEHPIKSYEKKVIKPINNDLTNVQNFQQMIIEVDSATNIMKVKAKINNHLKDIQTYIVLVLLYHFHLSYYHLLLSHRYYFDLILLEFVLSLFFLLVYFHYKDKIQLILNYQVLQIQEELVILDFQSF